MGPWALFCCPQSGKKKINFTTQDIWSKNSHGSWRISWICVDKWHSDTDTPQPLLRSISPEDSAKTPELMNFSYKLIVPPLMMHTFCTLLIILYRQWNIKFLIQKNIWRNGWCAKSFCTYLYTLIICICI